MSDTDNDEVKEGEAKRGGGIMADYDVEEARDRVAASLPDTRRQQRPSDITGIMDEGRGTMKHHQLPRLPGRKTVSDVSSMVALQSLPSEAVEPHRRRRRQKTSCDVIVKFQQAGQFQHNDLKMADYLKTYGNRRQRMESGISDQDFSEKIDELEAYQDMFEFNEKGLSSEEADKRLEQHGRNELPEKKVSLWLTFLRLFWAPMPIMIW